MHFHLLLFLVLFSYTVRAQSSAGPMSGSTASTVVLSGSASNWTNPTNSLVSDNQYATTTFTSNGDFSDYLVITNFGFNLPASSLILGIVVEVEHYGDRIKDNQIRIIKGGTIGSTDRSLNNNWPNSDTGSYFEYGGTSDLWGEAWTEADINASDFGFALSARRVGGGQGAATALIDHIRITVHYDTLLPVGLLSFESHKQENTVKLNWATAWEISNSHFEVQRASYDLLFETLGFVPGLNNSDTIVQYHYIDDSPLNGRAFYRIIQHDFNGTFDISGLIAMDFELLPRKYGLHPTLIKQPITLLLSDAKPEEHVLILVSPCGKQLNPIYPIYSETQIDPSYFEKPGVYFYYLLYRGKKVMSGKVLKP